MALTRKRTKRAVKRYWPLGIAVAALVVLACAWLVASPTEWVSALNDKIAALGAAGPIVYFLLYVCGTVVLAPSPLMSIAAGVAFGWWGLPLAEVSAITGAMCSFLLSRYFFGETLEDWLLDRPVFSAAKKAVDTEGWQILLLLRLSPVVPFGLLNYLLGLSKTSITSFLTWTAIGILPGTAVDIYIGVAGANANNSAQFAYFIVGLLATAFIVVLISIRARSYLREAGVKA